MEKQSAGRRAAFLGMLLALALLCSYVESLIPISFGIPGIKLGLANLVTVVTLYLIGAREACLKFVCGGLQYGRRHVQLLHHAAFEMEKISCDHSQRRRRDCA